MSAASPVGSAVSTSTPDCGGGGGSGSGSGAGGICLGHQAEGTAGGSQACCTGMPPFLPREVQEELGELQICMLVPCVQPVLPLLEWAWGQTTPLPQNCVLSTRAGTPCLV